MDDAQLQRVRSFNRLVTQRVGALEASYLKRGRPLGEARLLFEIGVEGTDLRALRDRLGLDSGYLSRLLNSLMGQGLIELRKEFRATAACAAPSSHEKGGRRLRPTTASPTRWPPRSSGPSTPASATA